MLDKVEGWKKIILGVSGAILAYGNSRVWWSVPDETIYSLWVTVGGIGLADFGKSRTNAK